MSLVLALGFTAEYVIKVITLRGVQEIDKVYIFTANTEDEYKRRISENTIAAVTNYLSTIKLEHTIARLDVKKPFFEILVDISNVLKGEKDLEFHLIGGMRILNLALYYYALLSKNLGLSVKVFSYTEEMDHSYELPVQVFQKPSNAELEILKVLKNKKAKVWEIATELGKSSTTVSRQIDSLESNNYVRCNKKRNNKECELSELGKLCLAILGEIKS